MQEPFHVKRQSRRKTVQMYWKDGRHAEFYVTGGLCWPVLVDGGIGAFPVLGAAVVIGMDTESLKFNVLTEHEFPSIDGVVTHDECGRVTVFPGLSGWMLTAVTKWGCRSFYHRQEPETSFRYAVEVGRLDAFKALRPGFPELHWDSDNAVDAMTWEIIGSGKVKIGRDTALGKAMRDAEISRTDSSAQADKRFNQIRYPVIHAFRCALYAQLTNPWRLDKAPMEM